MQVSGPSSGAPSGTQRPVPGTSSAPQRPVWAVIIRQRSSILTQRRDPCPASAFRQVRSSPWRQHTSRCLGEERQSCADVPPDHGDRIRQLDACRSAFQRRPKVAKKCRSPNLINPSSHNRVPITCVLQRYNHQPEKLTPGCGELDSKLHTGWLCLAKFWSSWISLRQHIKSSLLPLCSVKM